jgi:hypothetical protein
VTRCFPFAGLGEAEIETLQGATVPQQIGWMLSGAGLAVPSGAGLSGQHGGTDTASGAKTGGPQHGGTCPAACTGHTNVA